MRRPPPFAAALGFILACPAFAQFRTQLSPETVSAYDAFLQKAESHMDWRAHLEPAGDGSTIFQPGSGQGTIDVKDGLIHDWIAAAIAPGASMERVLALFQDYDSYQKHYFPSVRNSKLISRDGHRWHVYMRLFKKRIIEVSLDTEYDIEYRPFSSGRWAIVAPATKVAEIENGKPLPLGMGHGFLWRLNSYWILEPRAQGVYLECRAISLSRSVPAALGWAIKPMLTSVPKESLGETLANTLRALR